MPLGQTTTSDIASEVNVFYDKTLIEPLRNNLIYSKYGQKRKVQNNNTVKFEAYADLGTQPVALSEGVTPSPQKISKSEVTATVSLYGGYVEITEDVDIYTINQPTTIAQEKVNFQAVETVDEITRDIIHGNDNVMYAGQVAGRTDIVTGPSKDDLRKLARAMKANKAPFFKKMLSASTGIGTQPIPASYLMFISGEAYYDFAELDGWKEVHTYANQGQIEDQELGSVNKFRCIGVDNAPVVEGGGGAVGSTGLDSTDSAVDVHKSLAVSENSFGVVNASEIQTIRKDKGVIGGPLELYSTAGWKTRFTCVILQEEKLYRYEHGVSA